MKNLKSLGIVLSKSGQKSIHGGAYTCGMGYECPPRYCCPVDPNSGGTHT